MWNKDSCQYFQVDKRQEMYSLEQCKYKKNTSWHIKVNFLKTGVRWREITILSCSLNFCLVVLPSKWTLPHYFSYIIVFCVVRVKLRTKVCLSSRIPLNLIFQVIFIHKNKQVRIWNWEILSNSLPYVFFILDARNFYLFLSFNFCTNSYPL